MYLYRIYTEDKPSLKELVIRYFPGGATLLPGVGVWNGGTESSMVIEILGTLDAMQTVVDLAGDIRERNKQESVLVTWVRCNSLSVEK